MSSTPEVVLVTGASSGIGKATALRLAKAGFTVYATARRVDTLADCAAAGCRTLALDVESEESMVAAVRAIEAEHGAIDALVNNAGYSLSGALETLAMDDVRRQFETNVFGLLRLTQLVLPGMRRKGSGRVVNISSMGGTLTFPGGGAYHATKYAVEALSDALRYEVAGFGIKVIVVQPGLIRTRFGETAAAGVTGGGDDAYAAFNAAVAKATKDVYVTGPLAKLGGEPDDVAKVIERALRARRPAARYAVTPSASVLMTTRRLLPDSGWDAFLASNFPRPGAAP
jgi:NAD(P)-dependent dehydrogenase (short-subunit alcohol dehydrogenase family)